jgi:hypothetical protein
MPGLSVSQSGKQSPSSDGAYIWTSMAPFPASFPHGRPVASHGPLHILLAQIAQISRSLSLVRANTLLLTHGLQQHTIMMSYQAWVPLTQHRRGQAAPP